MEPTTLQSNFSSKGKFIGNYLFINLLGFSDFGEIWKAIHIEKEKLFAIKKIDKFKIDSNDMLEKIL